MIDIVKVLYLIISIPAAIYCFKKYRLSAVTIFLFMQILMFVGIMLAPKAATEVGQKLIVIYLFALVCFLLGVGFRSKFATKADIKYKKLLASKEIESPSVSMRSSEYNYVSSDVMLTSDKRPWQNFVIKIIVAVSILACVYFFLAAGMNVFVESMKNFISGENQNLADDREGYFGVSGMGYIYQFRVVLLPILTAYLVLATKTKAWIKLSLSILMLIFLLGTGQRNAFVFFVAIVIIYWVSLPKSDRHISKTIIGAFGAFAILAMVVLTIANGRVSSDSDNMIVGAIKSLIDRVLFVNQKTAHTAFNYINTQPTVWGYDWWMMMMDILPGKSGYLSVDRIVFYISYGNYSGTGPPCIWGSAWYNFSYLGVTLFPFILGFLYQSFYFWYKRQKTDSLKLLLYCSISFFLGIWFCGSPMNLFNNGVVTLFILYFLLYKIKIKRE